MFVCFEVSFAAFRPGERGVERAASAGVVGWIFGAFIKDHDDVGAEGDLDFDGAFGGKEMAAAIEVRAEVDAVGRDLAQFVEAEDLEAAGVREHGAGPADEPVQAAHAPDEFVAGAQVEVVSIAENDPRTQGLEDVLRDSLDGTDSADGHEDRCLHSRLAGCMRQVHAAAACSAELGIDGVGKGHIGDCIGSAGTLN